MKQSTKDELDVWFWFLFLGGWFDCLWAWVKHEEPFDKGRRNS